MGNHSLETNLTSSSEQSYKLVIFILKIIVAVVIVCGNVLIIAAVCRFKMLRSPCNVMIASLAVGDLTIGAVYLPMTMFVESQNYYLTEKTLCLLYKAISYFCVSLAMAFLSMLSVERFYAVQFPFHYHSIMTVTRSLIWSGITLAVMFVLVLPIICGIDLWTPDKPCLGFKILPSYYIWTLGFVGLIIFVSGFLSFVRILVAEISIRHQNQSQNFSDTRQNDSVKCTLMLTVYVISMCCWIPPISFLVIQASHPEFDNNDLIRALSLLGVCSSGVNCFIYGIKNSQFRAAFKKMFGFNSGRSIAPAVSGTDNNTLE